MNLVLFVISILTWNSVTVSCQRQDVHHMLYESFPSAVSCFRLLNGTHQFGCSSHPSGSLGVIHVIKAKSDVDWLFSDDAVAGPYMAVVSPQIFASEEVMNKLRTSSIVSGILLAVNGPTDRPDQMSPDDTCPNRYSGLPGTCNNKWNPYGLSYHLQDWGKPVFYVNDVEVISKVHECYKKFNLPLNQSQLTKNLCSLQMKGHMYAAVNTPTCIERSRSFSYLNPLIYCDPMGDRNIFTSLFPLKNVKEKSLIVVTTHLDGATMFDNLAPAAMSTATGIVTLMAAARVLSKMLPYNNNYSKNVIFIMFSGESYDYIGSSRAAYDIIKKKFPTKARSIDFEQIGYMFEINQLDKSRDLVFHYNDTDPQADSLSSKFKIAFKKYAEENKFTLKEEKDGSVLPPSSVQSFLKEYPKLPFSVLTNYEKQFKNRFYSSVFDNSSNIDYKYFNGSNSIPADSVQATLADLAIVLAKTLYKLITDKDYTEKSDYVDPKFMDDLLHCYLDTRQCQIFKDAFPYDRTPLEPSSVYVGVARSSNIIVTLTHSSLAYFTGNQTDKSSKDNCLEANLSDDDYDYIWITGKSGHGECYKSYSRFTTAVSPAFEIDDYDWSSGKYSTWSESVWQELNLRMFLKPSRQQEYLTLTLGLFIIILSFATVYWIKSRASILFHTKPGVVC